MGLYLVRYYTFYFFYSMGKEKKEMKKGFPLLTTPQSDAYKEIVKKEGRVLHDGWKEQKEQLEGSADNNYLSIFKRQYNNPLKRPHLLEEFGVETYKYDEKAKRDRHFNQRKEAENKNKYFEPLTSNQVYGWKEPIDTFPTNFGMKKQFDEKLIPAMKPNKPPKS